MAENRLLQAVQRLLHDVTTLEVITLSGEVTYVPPAAPPPEAREAATSLPALLTGAAAQVRLAEASQLRVVAYTRMQLDGDHASFVAAEAPEGLVSAHHAAFAAALRARTEVISSLGRTFRLLP